VSVTAIRLDLDGFGIDDVFDLLVTGRFVVVADVVSVQVALGVVTITGLVLAVVGVVVVVLYAPVKVVVGRVLMELRNCISYNKNEAALNSIY